MTNIFFDIIKSKDLIDYNSFSKLSYDEALELSLEIENTLEKYLFEKLKNTSDKATKDFIIEFLYFTKKISAPAPSEQQ